MKEQYIVSWLQINAGKKLELKSASTRTSIEYFDVTSGVIVKAWEDEDNIYVQLDGRDKPESFTKSNIEQNMTDGQQFGCFSYKDGSCFRFHLSESFERKDGKFQFTVPIEVDMKWVNDLLITATEGGVNYWCEDLHVVLRPSGDDIKKVEDWFVANDSNGIEYLKDVSLQILAGGTVLFMEIEDDHKDNEAEYTLTLQKVLRGIQIFTNKGMTESDHLKLDLENMDANDADLLIQYGLFGEVRFG
jgi:hypothetical protein